MLSFLVLLTMIRVFEMRFLQVLHPGHLSQVFCSNVFRAKIMQNHCEGPHSWPKLSFAKFCALAFIIQILYNNSPWCALKTLSWWKIAESVSLLLINKMYILAFIFLVSNAGPVSCCNTKPIPKSLAIIVSLK